MDTDAFERSLLRRRARISSVASYLLGGLSLLATIAFGIGVIGVFLLNDAAQQHLDSWWLRLLFYDTTLPEWASWWLFLGLPVASWSAFAYLRADAQRARERLQAL